MKKKLFAFVFAVLFALSGCSSAEDTSSQTAEVITTSAAATEPAYQEWVVNTREFSTYEQFLAEYTKERSSNYVYELPDAASAWETREIEYSPGSHYTLRLTDPANQASIMLEIDYPSTFDKISDYFDMIGYSYGAAEIVEQTDRYAIKHYLEFDSYSMIGITGEENIMYTLVIRSADETADPVALLKEYKELLEL
ncbi:MAG: hypothetical protein IJ496_06275 [Ruminococcus sp.]|nr:hypothetical protein [Ruminococcus sp.]